MATAAGKAAATAGFRATLARWAYNKSGFTAYGLKYHDCLYETPEVKEAIRRLPQKVIDERNFRVVRALQLSMQKSVLPKEQWQKYDDDDFYMSKYLEEVEREKAERDEWAKK